MPPTAKEAREHIEGVMVLPICASALLVLL